MTNDKVNRLKKYIGSQNEFKASNSSKLFQEAQINAKMMCDTLKTDTESYNPLNTIDFINNSLVHIGEWKRILYSEISNYIFTLTDDEASIFLTNVENLFVYSIKSDNNVDSEICKIIVKLYDHAQLINYEKDNISALFNEKIKKTKIELSDETKSLERQYISILGIFAAIVLAFVGGITFSNSVLENISNVSIFRLLMIVDALAFVLLNLIWMLVNFIAKINDKDINFYKIKNVNIILIAFAVVIFIAWVIHFGPQVCWINFL